MVHDLTGHSGWSAHWTPIFVDENRFWGESVAGEVRRLYETDNSDDRRDDR